jgi:hypothetical protein
MYSDLVIINLGHHATSLCSTFGSIRHQLGELA